MLGKVTKYEHKRKVVSKVMDKSMSNRVKGQKESFIHEF